jgi:uncharacterized surface protein with fasciclin (FAS1) repeats
MMKTTSTFLAAFALAALVFTASASANCGQDHKKPSYGDAAEQEAMQHAKAEMKSMNIVETAVSAGSFKTLVAAVQAAGLAETLQGEGPFTVFAPTDAAFAKLPAGTVDDLLKPENLPKLRAILTYHVISDRLLSSDVVKAHDLSTVQGQKLEVSNSDGKVMIDSAEVTQVDILASNGVIHVIDSVVLPQTQ